MMLDTKTMLIFGVSIGVIAFLIWTMFFKPKRPAPAIEEETPLKQEEQGDPKVMTM